MTTKEKIKVMQAFLDGEPIQSRYIGKSVWISHAGESELAWAWDCKIYRVEPAPLEFWMVPETKEIFDSEQAAKESLPGCVKVCHMREVIEE